MLGLIRRQLRQRRLYLENKEGGVFGDGGGPGGGGDGGGGGGDGATATQASRPLHLVDVGGGRGDLALAVASTFGERVR